MLVLDFLVMIGALVFFFFRAASDADRKQEVEDRARALPAPVPGQEVRLG
jgi:hypothetical protein